MSHELIARNTKNGERVATESLLQTLKTFVLRSESALRGHVHNQNGLAVGIGKRCAIKSGEIRQVHVVSSFSEGFVVSAVAGVQM